MDTNRPIPAVAAIIIKNGSLLLIKRGVEPSLGKWSVPGGSIEWGESLKDALKREVREETGLDIEVGEVAGVFDLIVPGDDAPGFHYVIIDYFARSVGGALKAGDDAADARWVPLGDLENYDLTEHLTACLTDMVHFKQ